MVTATLSILAMVVILVAFPAMAYLMIREKVYAPYGRLMQSFADQRRNQFGVSYNYRNRHYVRFLLDAKRSRIPIFLSALSRDRTGGIRIVSAFKPDVFRNLSDKTVESEIQARFLKNSHSPSLFVRFKDNRIEVDCWRNRNDPLTIEFINRVANAFCSLYGVPLQTDMLTESELRLEFMESQNSICMVCCEQVDQDTDIIVCDSCETPHHVECWNYFGGCSTFGCAVKTRSVAAS